MDTDDCLDTNLNPVPKGTTFQTVFVGAGMIAPRCRNESGWTNYKEVGEQCLSLRHLANLAKETHGGDMRAGTKLQQAAVDGWMIGRRQESDRHINYNYTEVCKFLDKLCLLHDRGYEYGGKWLVDADLLGLDLLGRVNEELERLGYNVKAA